MNVIWQGSLAMATKMEGEFTLDTGSHIFSHLDGSWLLNTSNGQIVVTEEELAAEREKFDAQFAEAYSEMPELDSEENW
jgi:hypothetical protein